MDTDKVDFCYNPLLRRFSYRGQVFLVVNANPVILLDDSGEYLRGKNSTTLIWDKKLILDCVKDNGLALRYAVDLLRADEEVVWNAFNQNIAAIEFAQFPLKKDPKVDPQIIWDPLMVLEGIQFNGQILQCAPDSVKSDKTTVLKAVQQNGMSLQFAHSSLRADRDVVLSAVQQNPQALQFADPAFMDDIEIQKAAMREEFGKVSQRDSILCHAFLKVVEDRIEYEKRNRERRAWLDDQYKALQFSSEQPISPPQPLDPKIFYSLR